MADTEDIGMAGEEQLDNLDSMEGGEGDVGDNGDIGEIDANHAGVGSDDPVSTEAVLAMLEVTRSHSSFSYFVNIFYILVFNSGT